MAEAVFIAGADGGFTATDLARGPWDPDAQHGGAPAALLMHAFEALPAAPGLLIARVSYEFIRPAPLGALTVRADVIRPGRRVQLLEGSLIGPGATEVVRARALQVQRADPTASQPVPPGPALGPEAGRRDAPRIHREDMPSFGTDAMDIRFVAGAFNEPGPATAWFRLCVPLVDGEEPSPLQRLAVASDFGNGISSALPWGEWLFINPDLTLYIDRPPVGAWVCVDARTSIAEDGVGIADSVLYDERGRVGRATQALLIAPQ